MKKKIALLLALVLLCLSFAGCTLEGMRETHLKFDENGNIPFNGQLYIPLADDRNLLNITIDYEKTYYTTEADVPLLLQDMFGSLTCVSKDGNFLRLLGECYCRSDIYEEMKARLDDPDINEYFCFRLAYSDSDENVLFSKDDCLWLKDILENTAPSEEKLDPDYSEHMAYVYACSEDMLLRERLFTIRKMSSGFYFEKYNEKTESYDAIVLAPEDSAKLGDILEKAEFESHTPADIIIR